MKKLYLLRMILAITLCTSVLDSASAQQLGANMFNAFNVGNLSSPYSDNRHNAGYGNSIGQPSADIYYTFTISNSMKVNISHCGSAFDTYMHLLSSNGTTIATNDDNGPLCSGLQSSIQRQLSPGTYYVVSEGYNYNSGYITTTISNGSPIGANMANAIQVGLLNPGITYSDTKSNAPSNGYINDFGQASDDIFYTFILNNDSEVEISHCNSTFDTYMHLLDANGTLITSNDDNGPMCSALQASIKMQLIAGTYFIISEGYSTNNGNITTTIKALENIGDSLNFTQSADYAMQHLDKSGISTGILYDRVFPFARLDLFGQLQTDTAEVNYYKQAYSELRRASYDTTALYSDDIINDGIIKYKSDNKVPIALITYKFNQIDTLAIQDGLIYLSNNLYYDSSPRSRSPYWEKTAVVVAALAETVNAGTVQFELASVFNANNLASPVTYVEIDFGNGLVSYTPGQTFTANFASGGKHTIKYVVHFGNGSQVITFSTLNVSYSALARNSGTTPCKTDFFTTTETFQGYDETSPKPGAGEVSYYFSSCNDQTLRKPIIIMDGFDPGDEYNGPSLYANELAYIDASGFPANFAEDMRAEGYDIIMLNFPKNPAHFRLSPVFGIVPHDPKAGADYIERNALVLVHLIKDINTQLAANGSTHELVIVGPSMGGLISKYALTYMEKKLNETSQTTWNHRTKLWLSFDSPHLGANIPIGDQYFLEFFARKLNNEGAKDGRNKLDTPAARQMLIHHFSTKSELPQAHWFRSAFLNNVNSLNPSTLGFPTQPRKVSVVNGSQQGYTTYSACQQAFSMKVQTTKHKSIFNWGPPLSSSEVHFNPSYGGKCEVFTGVPVFWGNLSRERKYGRTPSYSIGYDNAPGGTYRAQGIIRDGVHSTWYLNTTFSDLKETASFIPTQSALAYNKINPDLAENLSDRSLVCTGEIPFDNYFAPVHNEPHIKLTAANVAFIKDEIHDIKKPPIALMTIDGPTVVCLYNTYTYSIPDQGPGVTYTWNAPGFNIISGQGTPTVELEVLNSNHGPTLTISLEATSACFRMNPKLTTEINGLDDGTSNPIILGPVAMCPEDVESFNIESNPSNAIGYNWDTGIFTEISGQGTSQITLQAPSYNGWGSNYIALYIETACGWANSVGYTVYEHDQCSWYSYTISPNPAGDHVEVQAKKKINKKEETEDFDFTEVKNVEVKLYDKYSKEIKAGKLKDGRFRFDTSNLPNDIYIIHIINGKEITREKIIVAH